MVVDFFNNLFHSSFFFFSFELDRYSDLIRYHFFNFIWHIFNPFLRNDFVDHIIDIFSPFYWVLFLSLDWNLSSSLNWLLFNLCLFNVFSFLLLHVISDLVWHFINFLFSNIISHHIFSISSNRSLNSVSNLFRSIFDDLLSSNLWMHFLNHMEFILFMSYFLLTVHVYSFYCHMFLPYLFNWNLFSNRLTILDLMLMTNHQSTFTNLTTSRILHSCFISYYFTMNWHSSFSNTSTNTNTSTSKSSTR